MTQDGPAVLSFPIEAHGFGAILATPAEPDAAMQTLLDEDEGDDRQAALELLRMSGKHCRRQLVEIPATKPAHGAPEGMIRIPGRDFVFKVQGIEIEGSNDVGVDVQYPWEDIPRRLP